MDLVRNSVPRRLWLGVSWICTGLVVVTSFFPSTVQAFSPHLRLRPLLQRAVIHSLDKTLLKMAAPTNNRHNWIVSTLPGTTHDKPLLSRTHKPIPTCLVLHFDINETILLGDDAGGDSRQDSVQKMLAKSAFCQLPSSTDDDETKEDDTHNARPTHWWDGQIMGQETSLPPLYTGWEWPIGCCPYYRTAYKKFSKQFVHDHHGQIYQPILHECERELAKNTAGNHILPAFYHTLESLVKQQQQREFRLVFRTFGSDIEEIAKMVTEFAQGHHPDYPDFVCPQLELPQDRLFQGRWNSRVGSNDLPSELIYELWNAQETKLLASGDDAILALLKQFPICGIRDDYPFWDKNNCDPTAGKPVWVPHYELAATSSSTDNTSDKDPVYDHHLFFDDNIHNVVHDGIVCVRRQQGSDGSYYSLDGATANQDFQGVHMIRVPTIEPVLNPGWYLEQIAKATDRLQERLRNAIAGEEES